MDAIFFPRQDYPVQVCPHRYGKSMTYTEQTDTLRTNISYDIIMGMAKSRNIKVGGFAMYSDYEPTPLADYEDGKLWLDCYSYDPALATKIAGGQVITAEEFRQSYNNVLLPPFRAALGKKPIALSYSYGNTTFQDTVPEFFLAARGSGNNNETSYGVGFGVPNNVAYSKNAYKVRSSTTRWYDEAKTSGDKFAERLASLSSEIDACLQNGGWFNNFTHWHNVINDGNGSVYEDYFDLLAEKNSNGDINFAGYGEAVAYLVYRQIITKAVMYSPKAHPSTQLFIRLEAQNTLGIDTDLLQVPISVKFSTVGTPLAGKTITSDCNLVSLGGGDYIVEIPYTGRFPYAIIKG